MNFSEQLKYIMETEGLTQKQIAKKTGFTEVSIWRYVNGDSIPRMRDVVEILDTLGYEMDVCKKKHDKDKNTPLNKNGSGYSDQVACAAIRKVDAERERLTKLLDTIFAVCDIAGFHVEGRIELLDKRTGKVWK